MTSASRLRLATLMLVATPALWAVNYLVARLAADSVAPHALALGRWLIAAAILTFLSRGEILANRAAIGCEWRQFLVLGVLGMWICAAFVYVAAQTTTATNIGLLYAIAPVLIALFSTAYLKERMGPVQAVGVALAVAGVVHVVVKGNWAALAAVRFTRGDLWILAASLAWTAYSLLIKAWPSRFGNIARLALTCWAGVAVLIPLTLLEALAFHATEVSWATLGWMAALALFPGVGAYLSYAYMQQVLGAARVGVVMYLGPLYTAAFAWGLLGEAIHAFHFAGALLILPGIFLATRPARAGAAPARS